jgi:hydroxymethylpyrimidine/phosphomethylpyrimidine kinase
MTMPKPAQALTIAGHDPTGGAGVQADIEAMAAQGVAPMSVLTALTVQDTHNVRRVQPVAADFLQEALSTLLADCRVDAIKIGLIGDAMQVPVLAAAIAKSGVPVVLDPVLRAGGGKDLASMALKAAMKSALMPMVSLLTPNAAEARLLTGLEDLAEAGAALLAMGAANVLITGGDEQGEMVCNHWFAAGQAPVVFSFPRIEQTFHGAGCTLAAALAAQLALGKTMLDAIQTAQDYTLRTLIAARAVGQGRWLPCRLGV